MTKELKALEKLDNTLCLNNIIGNIEFGIDTEEHCDCNDVIEMTECLETVANALKPKMAKEFYCPCLSIDECLEFTYRMAFDLINEKRVDIKMVHWAYPSVEAYNVWVEEHNNSFSRKKLTKREFEFIGSLAGAK